MNHGTPDPGGNTFVRGYGGNLFHRRREPAGGNFVRLLILHGYGDHSGRYVHLMDWLADRGVACDAFDFRGHGRSEGKRGYVHHWHEFLDDLRVMVTAVTPGKSPLFVLGHSHGGLIAAAAGVSHVLHDHNVAGCVLSAPWLRSAHRVTWPWRLVGAVGSVVAPAKRIKTGLTPEMMSQDIEMVEESRRDPLLLRSATPRWFHRVHAVQRRTRERASLFRLPLLCVMGDDDQVASLPAARQFVDDAGTGDKTFHLLPGARHEILREAAREETFEVILAWLRRVAA